MYSQLICVEVIIDVIAITECSFRCCCISRMWKWCQLVFAGIATLTLHYKICNGPSVVVQWLVFPPVTRETGVRFPATEYSCCTLSFMRNHYCTHIFASICHFTMLSRTSYNTRNTFTLTYYQLTFGTNNDTHKHAIQVSTG